MASFAVTFEAVPVTKPDDMNVVIGQAHFIKTVEDLHETLAGVSPQLKFGLAFCEASAARLVRRSAEPSTMSLLGLVRHLAGVERNWFRKVMAGQDAGPLFTSDTDRDGDFDGAGPDPGLVAEAWQAWRAEVAFADRFVDQAPDLSVTGQIPDPWRGPMSLRWVLVHMIEEYARHNGHADLLRERIDGRLGQ